MPRVTIPSQYQPGAVCDLWSWGAPNAPHACALLDVVQRNRYYSMLHLTGITSLGLTAAPCLTVQAAGDEPVWRQLICIHLDHSDPDVARDAATTLVDSVVVSCQQQQQLWALQSA